MDPKTVNPFQNTAMPAIPQSKHLWDIAETLYKAVSPTNSIDVTSEPGKPLRVDLPGGANASGPFSVSIGPEDDDHNDTLIIGGTGVIQRTTSTPAIVMYNDNVLVKSAPEIINLTSLWPLPPTDPLPALGTVTARYKLTSGIVHTSSGKLLVAETSWYDLDPEGGTQYIYIKYTCTNAGVEAASVYISNANKEAVLMDGTTFTMYFLVGQVQETGLIDNNSTGDIYVPNFAGRTVSPDFSNTPKVLKEVIFKERALEAESTKWISVYVDPTLYTNTGKIAQPHAKLRLFVPTGRGITSRCNGVEEKAFLEIALADPAVGGLTFSDADSDDHGVLQLTTNIICDPTYVLGKDSSGNIGWVTTATCNDIPETCTPVTEDFDAPTCATLTDPTIPADTYPTGSVFPTRAAAVDMSDSAEPDLATRLLVVNLSNFTYALWRADYAMQVCKNWSFNTAKYFPLAWIHIVEAVYEDDPTSESPTTEEVWRVDQIIWLTNGWIVPTSCSTPKPFELIVDYYEEEA
jgi:hypothetical protein